jgi:hypothetical protein
MSLLWIIPAVWLLVAAGVVLLCRDAKRGDSALDEALEPARRKAELSGVVILNETSSPLSPRAAPDRAPHPAPQEASARDDSRDVLAGRRAPTPVGG